ncbi:hypothetical protein [Rhodocyclus tenuis]|uniref:Type 4a pilus biogenesis protein PilO n=1 Tax=Rhodocyclus tenuis TaxID=1066 RepID=A0A840G9Y6_RHOTE|nr:hypothetical protein [Rhodocyclus tenuis]MBB4249143.1 hypothetical protein [Rhodocyclus tenuis]
MERLTGGDGPMMLIHSGLWRGRRDLRVALRRQGIAGAAIAGLGAMLLVGVIALVAQDLSNRRSISASVLLQPTPAASPNVAQDHIAAFEARLLPADDVADVMRDLLTTAQASNLALSRGEYAREEDAAGGFVRVRMSFPLRGEGEAIHAYLLSSLAAHPALALERLQMQRERSDARDFEARIHWVLFVRSASSSASLKGRQ